MFVTVPGLQKVEVAGFSRGLFYNRENNLVVAKIRVIATHYAISMAQTRFIQLVTTGKVGQLTFNSSNVIIKRDVVLSSTTSMTIGSYTWVQNLSVRTSLQYIQLKQQIEEQLTIQLVTVTGFQTLQVVDIKQGVNNTVVVVLAVYGAGYATNMLQSAFQTAVQSGQLGTVNVVKQSAVVKTDVVMSSTVSVTLTQSWSNAYANSTTQAFGTLRNTVAQQFTEQLGGTQGFQQVTVSSFEKSGNTVRVVIRLLSTSYRASSEVQTSLLSAVNQGKIGSISVNQTVAVAIKQNVAQSVTSSMTLTRPWTPDLLNVNSMTYKTLKIQIEQSIRESLLQTVGFQAVSVARFKQTSDQKIQVILRIMAVEYAVAQAQQTVQAVVQTGQIGNIAVDANSATVTQDVTVSNTAQMTLTQAWSANLTSTTSATYVSLKNQVETTVAQQFANVVGFQRVVVSNFVRQSGSVAVVVRIVMADYSSTEVQQAFTAAVRTGQMGTLAVNSTSAVVKKDVTVTRSASMTITKPWSAEYVNMTSTVYKAFRTQVEQQLLTVLLSVVGVQGVRVASIKESSGNIEVLVRLVLADYASKGAQTSFQTVVSSGKIGTLTVDPASAVVKKDVSITSTASMTLTQPWSADLMNPSAPQYVTLKKQVEQAFSESLIVVLGFQRVALHKFVRTESNKTQVVLRIITADYSAADVSRRFEVIAQEREVGPRAFTVKNATTTNFKRDASISSTTSAVLTQSWSVQLINKTSQEYRSLTQQLEDEISIILVQNVGFKRVNVKEYKQSSDGKVEVTTRVTIAPYALLETQSSFLEATKTGQLGTIQVLNTSVTIVEDVSQSATSSMVLTEEWNPQLQNTDSVVYKELKTKIEQTLLVNLLQTPGFQNVEVANFMKTESNQTQVVVRIISTADTLKETQQNFVSLVEKNQLKGVTVSTTSATTRRDVASSTSAFLTLSEQTWTTDLLNTSSSVFVTLKERVEDGLTEQIANTLGVQRIAVTGFHEEKGKTVVDVKIIKADYATEEVRQAFAAVVQSGSILGLAVNRTTAMIENDVITSSTASLVLKTEKWTANLTDEKSPQFGALASKVEEQIRTVLVPTVGFLEANIVQFRQSDTNVEAIVAILKSDYATNEVRTAFTTAVSDGTVGTLQVNSSTVGYKTDVGITSTVSLVVKQEWNEDLANVSSVAYKNLEKRVEKGFFQALITTVGFQRVEVSRFAREMNQTRAKIRVLSADYATAKVQATVLEVASTGQVGTLPVDPASVEIKRDVSTTTTASFVLSQNFNPKLTNKTTEYQVLKKKVELELLEVLVDQDIGFKQVDVSEIKQGVAGKTEVVLRIMVAPYALSTIETSFVNAISSGQLVTLPVEKFSATFTKDVSVSSTATMTVTQSWSNELQDKTSKAYKDLQIRVEQEMTEKLVQTVGFHTIRVVNFKKTEANQVQVTVRIVAAGYSLTQAQQAFVRLVQTGRVVTIPVMSTSATVRKDVTKSRTAQMTLTKKWSAELTNMTSVVSTTLSKEVEEALRVELSATPGFQRIVIVDFKNSSTSTVVVTTRLMTASYAVKNIQNVFESSVSSGKIGTVTVQPQSAVVTEDVSTSATVSMSVPVTWSVDFQNKSSQAYQDLKVKIEQNVNEKLLTTAGLSGIEVTQLKQTQSGKVEVILRVVAAQYALTQVQQNFVTLVQTGRIGTLNAISSSAIIKKDVTLSKTAEMTVSQVWSAELTNTSSKAFTMLKTQVQEAVTSELVDTIGFQRVDVTTFKQGTSNTTVAVMRMIVAAYASKAVETSFQQVVSTGQVGTLRLNSTSATIITDVSVSSTMIMSVAQNWTMDLVNKTTEAYTVLVRKIEQEMNIELGNTVGFQRVVVTKFTKSSNNTVVTEVRMITAAYAVNAVENVFVQAVSTGQVQGIAVDKASANIVRDVSVSSQVTMTMNQTWSQEYLNTTTAVYKQLKTKIEETMTKTLLTTVGFQGLQVVEFKRTESNNIRVVVNMVTAQYAQTVSQQAFVNAVTTGQIADLAVVKTSAAIQKVVTTSQTAQVTVNQPWSSELMNKTTKTFITLQKQVENGISVELGNTIGFQRAMVVNFKQSSSNTIIVTTRLIAASYATGSVQSAFVSTVTNGQINQIVVDKASAKIVKDVSTSSSVTMTLNQSWSANFTNVKSVTYQQLKAKIEESITTKMLTTFGVQGVQVAGFKQTVSSQIQVILRIVAAQYAQSAAQQMFVTVVQTGQIDGLSVITTSAVVQKDVTVSQTAQMTLTKTWSADLVNMTSASSVELKTQLQESLSVVFGNTVGFQRVSVVEFKQSSSNTVAVITRIVVASYATTPVQTIFVTTVKSGRIGVISVNTASVVVKQDVSTSSTVTMTVKQAWSTDLMNVTTTSYQTLKTKVEEAMTEKLLMTVGFQGLEVAEFRRTESNTTQVIVRIVTAQYAATATQNAFVTVVTTNQVTGLAIDNTSAVIQNDVTVSQTAQMTLTQQWSVDLVNKTSVTFTTLQTQLQESLSVEFGTVVGFQRADVVQFSQSATNTTVVVVRMIVTSYAAPAVQTNFVTTVSSGQLGGISVTANSATVKKDVSVSSSLSLAVTQAWSADLQDTTSVAYKQLKTQVEETMTLQLLETVGFQGLQVAEFRRTESNTIQVVVRIVTAQYAATATQNAFVTVVTKGQVVGLAVDNTSAVVQKDGFQRAIVVGFTKSSTNTIVVTIRMIMASYAAKPVQTTVERTVQSGQLGGISVNPAVAVTVKQDVSVSSSLSLAVKNTWSADLQTTTSVAYKQLKTQVEESMTLQLLETVGFQGLQVAEFRRTESNTIQVIVRIVTAQYAATATQQAFVTVVTSGQVTGLSVDNTSAVVQKDVTVSQTAQMTLTQTFSADLVNKTSVTFMKLQTQMQEALTVQFGTTVGFQRVNVVEFTKSSTNTVVVVVRMVMASYAAGPVQTTLVQTVKSGQIGTISVNSNVTATVKKDVSVSSSLSLAVKQAWSADLQDTTSVAYKKLKTQVEETMTLQLLETVGFQGLQVAEFKRTESNTIQVIVRIVTAQYAATATQQAFVTAVTSGQVTGLSVDNTSAVVQNDVTVSQTAQMTLTQAFSADLVNKTSKTFITLQTQLQEALTVQFGTTVGFQRVNIVEFTKSSTNTVVVVVRMVMASYAAGPVQTALVQTVASGQIGTISVNSNVTATVKKDVSVSSSLSLAVTQVWSADLQDTTSVAYKQLKTQVEESMTVQLLNTVGFQGLQVAEFRRTKTNTIEVIVRIVTAQYAATATQQAFVTVVTSGQVTGLKVDNTSAVVQNDVTVSQTAQMTLTQRFSADLANKTSKAFVTLQTQLQESLSIQFGNTVGFQRVVVVEFAKSSTNTVVVVVRVVVASYAASDVQNTFVQTVTSGQLGGISINSNVTATVKKDVTLSSSAVMTLTQSWSADLKDKTSVAYRQLQTKIEESLTLQLLQTVGFQGLQVTQFKQTQSNRVEVVIVIAAAEYAVKQTQQSFVTMVRSGNVGSLSVDASSVVVKNDIVVSQTAQMTLSQTFTPALVNKESAVFIALQTKLQDAISVQMGNTLGFQRVVVVEFQNSTSNSVVVVMRMVMASYAAKTVQTLYQASVSAGQIGGISVVPGSSTVTKDVVASASVSMTMAQSWSADLLNVTSQTYQQLTIQIEEVISQILVKILGAQAAKVGQFKRTKSGQVEVVLRLAATDYAIKTAQQSVITQVRTGNLGGLAVVNTSAVIKKDVTVSQTAQMTLTQAWSADLQNTSSQAYITLVQTVQESLSVQLGNTLGFQRVVVVEFKQSSTNTVVVVTRLVVASYAASNVQASFAQAVSSGEISGLAVNSTSAVVTKDVSVSSSVTMTVAQAWSAQLQDQSSQNFTTLKNKLEEELTRKMATITGFQGVQVAQFKRSESGQVQAIVRVAAADHAIAQAQQTFVTVVQSGTIAGVSVDASSANIQKTVTTSQTAQMTLTQAWSADLQNTTSVAFTTLQTKLQESLSVELGNTLGFQRVVVTEFKKSSSNTVIVVMRLVVATYASSAVQNTFTEAVSIGQIGTITVDSTSAAVTKDVSTSSSVSMTVNQAWSAQLLNTSSTEYVTFKTRTEQALTKSMLNVVGFSGLEVGQLKQSSSGKVLVKLRIVAAEYALAQAQQSFVTVVQSGNVEGISVDTASAVIQKDVTTSQTAEVTLTQAYSADLQNTTSVAFTTLQQKVQDDLSVELGNTVGFQRAVVVEFKQSSTNTVVAVTRLVVATYAASAAQSAFVKTVSSGQIGTIAVNATSATVSKDVSASSTMSMTVTQPFSADLLNSSSTAYQALVVKIEKSMTSTLLTTVGFQAFEVARFKKTSSGQVEVVVRVVAAEYALAAAQQSFVTVVKTGSVAGLSLDTTSAVVKKTVTASQTAQMTLTQAWSADLQQTSSATFTTLQTTVQEALTVELGNTVGFQSVNVVSFKESSTSTVTAVVRMIVVSYATTSVQNSFTQVVSSGQVGTITVNKTSAVVKKDVGLSTTVSMTVTQAWSTDLQNTTSQAFITLQTNIQQAMTKSLQATTGFQAVQVSQFKQTQSGKVQVILRIVAAEYALTTAQESFTTVVQTGSVAGVSVDASSAVVQKDVTVSRTLQMTIKQAFTAALQDTSSEAFVTLKTQVQDAVTEEMSATVGFQRAVVAEFKQDSSSTVAVIRTVMASYASNEVQNAFVTVVKSGQVGNLVVDANSATIKQDVTVTRTASVTLNQVWSATLLNKSSTEFKTLQTQTETQMTSVLLVIVGIQGVTVSEFKDSSSKAEAVVRLVVADYASKDSQTSFANVVKTGTIGTISVDPTSAVIKKDVSITSTTSMTLTQSFTADLTNTTSAAFIALKTKVEQSISETLIQTVGFQRVEIVEFVRTESGQVQAKVRIVVADFATNTVQTAFTTAVKTGSVGALTVDPTSVVVEKDVSTTSTISMKMTSVTWNAALLNTSSTTFSSLKLDVEESLLLVMVSVVGFQRVEVAEFKQSSGNVEVVLRMMVTSYASAGVSTSFTQVVATGNIGTITVDPTSALVTKDVNVATKVAMTVTQTWNQQLTNTSSTVYTQLKTQLETSLQQTFLTIVGFQRVEIQEFKKVGSNIQVIIILVVAQYATTSVSTSFSSVVSSGTIGTITVDVNSATEEKVVPVTRSTTVSLTETWNAALLDSSSTQSKTLKTKVENSFFEVFVFITGFQRVTVVEFKESSGVVSVVLRISLSFAASSSFVTTIKTAVSSGKIAAVSVNPASLQLAVDQRVVQQATFKLTQPWSANLLVVTSTEFITLKKTVETQFFQTFVNINGFQSVTVKEFQESSGTVTVIFYIIVAEFATTTVSTTFTTAVQSGTVGTLTVVTTSAAVTVPVERTIYGNIVVSNSYDCNLVDMTSSNYTGFVSQFTTNAPQALPLIPGFKSFEALWLGTWRDGGILVNIKLNVSEATTKDDVQQWLKTISEGGDFGDLKLKVAYGAAASEAELPQPAQADFQLLNLTLSTASPKQIHPAGVVKTKFDFFIKNLGNVDVGVTPNGFATFKAYLTNNAELESATVKSNATGVSVPVSSEALLHVGVQKKGTEQIGMMNVVAPLEVPASNCAAFTHVCINAVTADVPAFFDYQPCNNDVCYELKAVGAGGGLEKNCPRITGVCSPACDTHATCHRESGSPTCECDHGYTGNGQTCTDINECSTNPCDASANQVCKNLEGSFECTCNPGYKLKDGVCVATSQFRSNVRFTSLTYTADLANPTSTVYINTVRTVVITVTKVFKLSTVRSSFVGVTVLGFSPGSVKADVSLDVASDANLTPSDMSGAFQNGSAALNDSSLGLDTSSTVTDFNECANGTDNDCSPYANCNNTVGGFSCSCLDGFLDNSTDSTRPGRICVNITKPSAAPPTTAFTVPPTASMRPPNATAPPTAAPTASVSAPSIPASLLRGPSTGLPTIRPTTAGTQQATAVPPSLSLSPGIKPTAPLTAAPTVAPTGSLGLQPSTAAVAPTAASPGAGQTTAPGVQPTASVQPTGPVVQPTASVQPTAPVVQPTASVQPTAPVVKPTGSIQPSAPAVQPSASVQPTAPVVKPTGSIQPSAPVVQPTASVQPTVVVAQPTASVQPTVPVVKPTGSQELQPSPSAGAPGETQSTAPVAPSASAGQATADPSAGLQGTAVPSASAAPAVQPTASVAPSVAASASPAPTTAGPTGTLPPGTAVVEAGTVKVNSRSPNTFSPAESVTMQFDYTFENKGNTDIPASNTTNAVLKVYLTNNAQFESATIKSPPSPVTLSAFDSALTRQGIKQGASFRALDATATVSVPEANCASFTHLCTVVTYAGLSSAYADKADTCLPLGSGSNQAGVLDCNKVTQTTCSGCASNAVCASVSGTAKCVCKGGFTGDGTTCTDVNECTSGSPCSSLANSRCVNTVGSYECQCVPRYYKNRRECKATETYQVEVTFTAYNYTSGLANSDSTEYKQLEYTYSEEMSNVYLTSTLKDSFHGLRVLNFRSGSVIGTHAANLASNSGQSTSSIKNAVNSAIGSTAGTPLNMQASVKVADYNECAKASDHDCHEKADCVNTMGSFTCKCKTGYEDRNPSTPGKDCYDAARLAIIIGGVIGGLLALLLLACLFHQCIKNRRGKKKSVDLKSVDSGAGSLVWARQDPRTFWWPGEVVPGKDGDNSLWVKWLGINTFSPVDSVEVDKFQSLNQHFSAKAHSSLRSYRAGIDEVKRKSMPSSDPEQAPPYNGHYTEAQPEKPALSPQYKSLIVPYYQDLQPQYAQQQEVSQVLARPPRPSVKEPPKYSSGFKGKDEYQEISFKLK
ncbi:TECTA [Branchiostoma lanceolatum]|uniref:TECTA protein n=1 Tax=Branchiostoma lanceolatum TaxID=7740 RepID=A0A8J9Z5Q3_BRALA|nr:TECTA [Branchiostoma lanceolatum]